jgi:hypothetical protein
MAVICFVTGGLALLGGLVTLVVLIRQPGPPPTAPSLQRALIVTFALARPRILCGAVLALQSGA